MASKEIKEYYEATTDSEVRADLIYAVDILAPLTDDRKIAIDCGCGAGSDIAYLLKNNFKIYGFDLEALSVSTCQERFKNNANVVISQNSFSSFQYPPASLIVADASLFFCPKKDFDDVWNKMHKCLFPQGIFCGSFLGPEDTMAGPDYNKVAFWPDILAFNEEQVKSLFANKYEILRFSEHKVSGQDPDGTPHHWHIFSVAARKLG